MAHASEGRKVGHPPKSPCSLKDVGERSSCSRRGREGSRRIGRYPHPARAVPNQRGNAMHSEGLTFASLARTKVALYSGWG